MTDLPDLEAARELLQEALKESDALGLNHQQQTPAAWRVPSRESLAANGRVNELRRALYEAEEQYKAALASQSGLAAAGTVQSPATEELEPGLLAVDPKSPPRPIVGFWVDTVTQSPPAAAEMVVRLLAPARDREAILGDLQEAFEDNLARYGAELARRAYWVQAIYSVPKFLIALLVLAVIRLAG